MGENGSDPSGSGNGLSRPLFWTILGAIAAVIALPVAFIAPLVTNGGSTQTTNATPNSIQMTVTPTTSIVNPASPPGPTAEAQAPLAATVRHSGQLVLATIPTFASADLDAPKSDPQWTSPIGIGPDIENRNGSITVGYGARALALGEKKSDYETCRSRTGYISGGDSIDSAALVNNEYLCVITTDGRFAALKITKLDRSAIGFDVVVYNPPG